MRRSNKCLSLLLVTFIVGVNALTACGQIPHTKAETAESADHSDLSFPFSDHVQRIRAVHPSQLKTAVKAEQSHTGKVPGTVKISSQNTALNLRQKPAEPNAVPLESQTGTQISGERNTAEHASIVQNPPCTATNEEPNQTQECTAIEYIPMTCTESHVPEQQDTINSVPDTPETEMPEQPDDDKPDNTCYQECSDTDITQTPQHAHNYVLTPVSPTCISGGYTLYTCACGDSFIADETDALGHDWEAHTENIPVRQEPHEICCDCGLDLTANGITGTAIADHSKNHVLSDDNASGRTLSVLVDVCEDVTSYTCTRCGASK